jgi:hypothetical protein
MLLLQECAAVPTGEKRQRNEQTRPPLQLALGKPVRNNTGKGKGTLRKQPCKTNRKGTEHRKREKNSELV